MLRVACQANSEVDPEKAKKVKTSNATTAVAVDVAILRDGAYGKKIHTHPDTKKLPVSGRFLQHSLV